MPISENWWEEGSPKKAIRITEKATEREKSGLLLVQPGQMIAKVGDSCPAPDCCKTREEETILITLPQWLVVTPFHPPSVLWKVTKKGTV